MIRLRFTISAIATMLGLAVAVATADAQVISIAYVSRLTGDDGNGCGAPTQACATINGALAKVISGGEIRCLDSHFETLITVTKPVTIDCGALNTVLYGANDEVAITINLTEGTYPNGVVTLRNVSVQGFLGFTGLGEPGADGIRVIGGGGAVHVENSTILGFAQQGIDFTPNSSVDLFVRNTSITNNAGGGVVVRPGAAATVRGALGNVHLDGNGSAGLNIVKASGAIAEIAVVETQVIKNLVGLQANGASASILLDGSTVAHNTTGLRTLANGKIFSFGNNAINRNTVNGAPTGTLPLR
jgi:hypothetical protein